jgi:two-component system sensor histidine kinase YesM
VDFFLHSASFMLYWLIMDSEHAPKRTGTLRGWLLSYNLAMLSIILALVIILFSLVFSLLAQMQNRNNRYEALNTLSGQLMQSRALFRSISTEQTDTTSLLDDYTILDREIQITLHRLAIDYATDSERYFLHRGIANGLDFINESLSTLRAMDKSQSLEYYNLFYTADKVYTYLQDYSFNHYLSAVVEADVNWMQEARQRILNYRSLAVLLFLLIAVTYSIAVYKMTMRLVNPVNEMVQTARDIFHGKFEGPAISLTGPDELRYLEESMNQMRQSLKERLQMIEENAKLEKTVHDQELEQMRTTRELEKARYKALQSQINPHFLFNTLNIISRTALFENANSTVDLIDSLASIFRYTLEYHDDVSLKEELQFVREYLTIQQFRFKQRLTFTIDCPAELGDMRLPPLVIQPFVENAMVHGLEPKVEGGSVTISVEKSGKRVKITILDTGVGINMAKLKEQKTESKQHIGIKNIADRLKLYFKGKSEVTIERASEAGGTIITLVLPYRTGGKKHVYPADS